MKLPSLGSIGSSAIKTAAKYPLPLAMAATAAVMSIYSLEAPHGGRFEIMRIALTVGLGAALFLAAQLLPIARKFKIGLFAAVGAFLVFYALDFREMESDAAAYALHCIAAVIAVIVAPFIFKKNKNSELWEWSKSLFIRGLLAFLYSHVLYGGIALALVSIEQLFGVNWRSWFHIEIYADLWMIMGLFVGPWIFLAGLPDPASEEEPKPYPRSLRAFALYVLLPIAGIYSIILYAYAIRILFNWELPNGWVSSLILAFAGVGLVTLLLLYPLLKRKELGERFAKLPRIFFAVLLPLLILLYFAIARRLADYGMTERRYLVVAAMIWLAIISIYFLIKGFEKFKPIPVSLMIALALISFGPWGAFSISEASQTARLINILKEAGSIKNGKLIKGAKFNRKQAREINQLSWHLGNNYEYKKLNAELSQYGVAIKDSKDRTELISILASPSLKEYERELSFDISLPTDFIVNVEGADQIADLYLTGIKDITKEYNLKSGLVKVYTFEKDEKTYLAISSADGETKFDLSQIADGFSAKDDKKSHTNKSVEEMTFTASTPKLSIRLIIENLNFEYDPEVEITYLRGILVFKSLK